MRTRRAAPHPRPCHVISTCKAKQSPDQYSHSGEVLINIEARQMVLWRTKDLRNWDKEGTSAAAAAAAATERCTAGRKGLRVPGGAAEEKKKRSAPKNSCFLKKWLPARETCCSRGDDDRLGWSLTWRRITTWNVDSSNRCTLLASGFHYAAFKSVLVLHIKKTAWWTPDPENISKEILKYCKAVFLEGGGLFPKSIGFKTYVDLGQKPYENTFGKGRARKKNISINK